MALPKNVMYPNYKHSTSSAKLAQICVEHSVKFEMTRFRLLNCVNSSLLGL